MLAFIEIVTELVLSFRALIEAFIALVAAFIAVTTLLKDSFISWISFIKSDNYPVISFSFESVDLFNIVA